jgi:DNA-binding transcriptional LysR family regulator
MNLQHLRSFLVVATKRNYTRAAEELFLTQSAISQQIQQLEKDLGLKLFERTGNKIYLTEAGRILESEAKRILAQVAHAREIMDELNGLKRGRIRIGASTTPGIYVLPHILGTFRKAYPDLEASLSIDNTRNIERRILANELDFAFVGRNITREDITVKPFLDDYLVPIAPISHPLCSERRISPRQLTREPFILREEGSATREAAESWAMKNRITLKVAYEFDSPEAVKMAVISGLGVSILSAYAVSWELETKRLAILDVKGDQIHRSLTVIHHKDKHLTSAALAFLETAYELQASGSFPAPRKV